MTAIDLKEYAPAEYTLSAAQRDALLREARTLDLSIEPVLGSEGSYRLSTGPKVGAIEIDDLSVLIEPKIGIPQLLSLACYAIGVFRPQERLFDFEESKALPDTLAIALASAARGPSFADCCMDTAKRRRRYRPSGVGSGSRSRCGVISGSCCRSRSGTTSSRTTSWRTGW